MRDKERVNAGIGLLILIHDYELQTLLQMHVLTVVNQIKLNTMLHYLRVPNFCLSSSAISVRREIVK